MRGAPGFGNLLGFVVLAGALTHVGLARADTSAVSLELITAESEVVGRARVVGLSQDRLCRIVQLQVLKAGKGEAKDPIALCLMDATRPVLAVGTEVVIAANRPTSWFSKDYPGVFVPTRDVGLQVLDPEHLGVIQLHPSPRGLIDAAFPSASTARRLPLIAESVDDLLQAVRDAAHPQSEGTVRNIGSDCQPCVAESLFQQNVPDGLASCGEAIAGGVQSVAECLAQSPTSAGVYARSAAAGMESGVQILSFHAASGPIEVLEFDPDIEGGRNFCMAAAFETSCDGPGLDDHLLCRKVGVKRTLCAESETRVLHLLPSSSSEGMRCTAPEGGQLTCGSHVQHALLLPALQPALICQPWRGLDQSTCAAVLPALGSAAGR